MKRIVILFLVMFTVILINGCSTSTPSPREWTNLSDDKNIDFLIEYNNRHPCIDIGILLSLDEIITIADSLAEQNDINSFAQSELIQKMRNDLGELYSKYLLRFRQDIESQLLGNLYKIALGNKISYVRLEAVISIDIIGDKRSLPILSTIRENDKDELVRKYALRAINGINSNNKNAINYKNEINDMVEMLKVYEAGGRLF